MLSRSLPLSFSLLLATVFAQQQPQQSLVPVSINVAGQAQAPAAQTPAVAASSGAAAPQAAGSRITILPQASGAPAPAAGTQPVGQASAIPAQPAASGTAGIGAGTNAAGSVPVWVVKVGSQNNDLVFAPNEIKAKVGDMVQFQFWGKNHSVVASSFDQPCVPLAMAQPAAPGVATNMFYSGFVPTEAQGQLTFTFPVRDTNPVWFYCSQGKHCQAGMVGVINPPAAGSPESLAAFVQKAAAAPNNISPGGAIVAPGGLTPPGGAAPPPAGGSSAVAPPPGATMPTQTGQVAQATKNAAVERRTGRGQSLLGIVAAGAAGVLLL